MKNIKKAFIAIIIILFIMPFIQSSFIKKVFALNEENEFIVKIFCVDENLDYSNIEYNIYSVELKDNLTESVKQYDNEYLYSQKFNANGISYVYGSNNSYMLEVNLSSLPSGYGVLTKIDYISAENIFCEFVIYRVEQIDYVRSSNGEYNIHLYSESMQNLYATYDYDIEKTDSVLYITVNVNGENFYLLKELIIEDELAVAEYSTYNSSKIVDSNNSLYSTYENYRVYYNDLGDEVKNTNASSLAYQIANYMCLAEEFFSETHNFPISNLLKITDNEEEYNVIYLNVVDGNTYYDVIKGSTDIINAESGLSEITITYSYDICDSNMINTVQHLLESVCVHEYFHAIISIYRINLDTLNVYSNKFVQESFATFMQVYYISEKNAPLNSYTKQVLYRKIWLNAFSYESVQFGALSFNGSLNYEMSYGASLFPIFLYEEFGNIDFVYDFFEYYVINKELIIDAYEDLAEKNETTFSLLFENFGIFRVAPSKYISELNNYYFTDFYIDNIEELKYIIDDSVYQDNSPGIGSNVNNLYSSKSVLMHSWHCIQIDNSNINNSQIVKLTLSNVKFSNLKIYTVEKNGDELLIVNEITSNENNITLETSYSNLINNDLFIIIMNCSETNVSDAYTFSLTVESINVNESISTSNTQPIAFETNKQTYFRNVYVGDSGYYRFELDVDNADILNLREHSIEIYDNNMNLVKKFNHTNAEHAFSKDNQNSIVVYLNKTYNILEDVSTPYYLRIGVFNENIDGFIKIQNITDEEKVIDEDNYNEDGNFSNLVQIENVNGDNFSYYNFPIDGTLRILFDVPEYTSGVINFVVVASNSLYSSNISYYLYTWDNENDVIEAFVDTEVYKNICILIFSDTYQSKINISYTLECQNDFSIILDSSSTSLDLCGSEVRLNNGLREKNNITVGFTRNAFLSEDAPTNSRLEYYWISSNEKVASISQYGTILAVDEGKTIIQAKYNNDKYAIILVNVNPDTNTNPATFEITTDLRQDSTVGTYVSSGLGVSGENDLKIGYTRLLSLTNNAPSTIIQHYTWSTSDPTIATVSMYGTVQAKGVGIVTITAVYKYNSRYTSTIQIEIY